jgi:hypothetical protein
MTYREVGSRFKATKMIRPSVLYVQRPVLQGNSLEVPMRNAHAPGKQIAVFVTAAICVALLESETFAQRRSRTYPVDRRLEELNRQAEQYERDRQQREIQAREESTADRLRTQSTVTQVKEDFGRIQTIYNDVVLALSAGKTLDEAFIAKSAAGINKCATRLKSNLALPQSVNKNQERQNRSEDAPLKSSLKILLNHISQFVTNPLFESPGVLDIELSTRASSDLDEIIHLSEKLRKRIEKPK